jgi:hypothetical protein
MLPARTSTQAKRKSRVVPRHSFCTIHLLPNNVKGKRKGITLSWFFALQVETQNCFTSKESEDKALDSTLKLGDIEVNQESGPSSWYTSST